MRYFWELSKEDKERAINKLMLKPRLKFTNLLRVEAATELEENFECVRYAPACVVRFYYLGSEVMVDLIFDHSQDTISKGYLLSNCMPCHLLEIEQEYVNHTSQDIARKALVALLNSSKNYLFDEKFNAYPL